MRKVLILGCARVSAALVALGRAACRVLDIVVPRFVTEDVALMHTSKGYEIVCSMADVRPYESFHAVARMRSFNVFGRAMWPRMIGKVRPWSRPSRGHGRARGR